MSNTFSSAIFKTTAFCNLNCTYCYMFNGNDTTYRRMPKNASVSTMNALVQRISDHMDEAAIDNFNIILHGGEPMLWPLSHFEQLMRAIDKVSTCGKNIHLSIQTNLYKKPSDNLLDILLDNSVAVSVSLDGPGYHNDKFRIAHNGKGSYERVIANCEKLMDSRHRTLLKGFLAVADPCIPPKSMYKWIRSLPVPRIDLLLPIHLNHDRTPWAEANKIETEYGQQPTYGKWLNAVFDHWLAEDDPRIHIRLFMNTIELLLGGTHHVDSLVNDGLDMFVVNTDGAIEYHDYLRYAVDGSMDTGLNVHSSPLSLLRRDPLMRELFNLRDHAPASCRTCSHFKLCGGGFLPGRIKDAQFASYTRSAHCYDQFAFFSHVKQKMRPMLANMEVLDRITL